MLIVKWHDDYVPSTTWFMLELDRPERDYQMLYITIDGDRKELPRSHSSFAHSIPIYINLDSEQLHNVEASVKLEDELIEISGYGFGIPAPKPQGEQPSERYSDTNVSAPKNYVTGSPKEFGSKVSEY